MQKHPIDDLFGRKLQHASLKPSADAWNRLQERQGTQKRPFAVWWYSSVAACLLLLGLAAWFGYQTSIDLPQTPALAKVQRKLAPQIKYNVPAEKTDRAVERVSVEPNVIALDRKKDKTHTTVTTPSESVPVMKESIEIAKAEPEIPKKAEGIANKESELIAKGNLASDKDISPTRPSAEERTLIVQLAPPHEVSTQPISKAESQSDITDQGPKKKRTKVGRILKQLNKLREGEPIDWHEVGVQPGNILAKATRTVDEGREKIADSYENIRSNAFKKNSEK